MSKHIDALKNYQAPWWSRLIGFWRAYRMRRLNLNRVELIAIISAWTRWTDIGGFDRNVYFCYRNGRGNRFYKHQATNHLLDNNEKRHNIYIQVVVPWISGKMSDQTLREYEQITQKQPA